MIYGYLVRVAANPSSGSSATHSEKHHTYVPVECEVQLVGRHADRSNGGEGKGIGIAGVEGSAKDSSSHPA